MTVVRLSLLLLCFQLGADAQVPPDRDALKAEARKRSLAFSERLGLALKKNSAPVPVSDELHYPTPMILNHLSLNSLITPAHKKVYDIKTTRRWVHTAKGSKTTIEHLDPTLKIKDKKSYRVLSIGEGLSGFVPFMRKLGFQAFGLDIAYDDHKYDFNPYVQGYKKKGWLKTGDGTYLKNISSGTYDLVVSHRLMAWLTNADKKRVLSESFRVLKQGGRAHHSVTLLLQRPGNVDTEEQDRRFKAGITYYVEDFVKEALENHTGEYQLTLVFKSSEIGVKSTASTEDIANALGALPSDGDIAIVTLTVEDLRNFLDLGNPFVHVNLNLILHKRDPKP